MTSLIDSESTFALLSIIVAIVAMGIWAETRPKLGQFGVIGIIILGSLISAVGLVPRSSAVYNVVSLYFVPLAIPLLLFSANLQQIWKESGRVLTAFLLAAFGTIAGAVIAIQVVSLGESEGAIAGILTSGFVGGSANTAAVSAAVGKSNDPIMGPLVASAYAIGVPFMALLLALPSTGKLWKLFSPYADSSEIQREESSQNAAENISAHTLSAALAASIVICALSHWIAEVTGMLSLMYLSITVLSVAGASIFPKYLPRLTGHYQLGQILIYAFFVVIGIKTDYGLAMEYGPSMMYFSALVIGIHIFVLCVGGRMLKLTGPELAIASNACILGPPTAAAMASSRGWNTLITPAILCGVLGYAIANFIGVALAQFL